MKTFNLIDDMVTADVDEEIITELRAVIDEEFTSDPFEYSLGGPVNIVETVDDLARVEGYEVKDGKYLNLLNGAKEFESSCYLLSKRWAFFYTQSSDAGGPSYFVPESLFQHVPDIGAIINHDFWSPRGVHKLITRVSPISCKIVTRYVPVSDEQYAEMMKSIPPVKYDWLTEDEYSFIVNGATIAEMQQVGVEV